MRQIFIALGTLFSVSYAAVGQQMVDLFIGTYTGSGSYGIYVARFNINTGQIFVVDSLQSENPSYLSLNAKGNRLYAVNENGGSKPGTVSSFQYSETNKRWAPLNERPVASGGDHPCYISIDSKEKFLAVANYSGGSMGILPLDDKGSVGDLVQLLQQSGKSIDAGRQQGPHVHTAVFSPNKRMLLIADLGTDYITSYPFNADKEWPVDTTRLVRVKSVAGAGPRHIDFHPLLPIAYVMEELSGKVAVYKYGKRGLVLLQTILADSISEHPGSADIHVGAKGKYLYASNRGTANNLAVFSIHPKTGLLTGIGTQATMGIKPRNFTIDPSGKFLLVANQQSNDVVIFKIDGNTGMPVPTGNTVPFIAPVCLVFGQLR